MFLLTGYLGTALKTLEKRFCFISFNALIYFGDIFFIYPGALWVDPLPTFVAAYPINFILFSASCIPYRADPVSG